MLNIEIPGKGFLNLFDTTKIPLTIKNPLFHEIGTYSFTFNIPLTDHNILLLGNPDMIETYELPGQKEDIIIHNSAGNMIGSIVVKDIHESIECYALMNEGSLNSDAAGIKITEPDYGGDIDIGSTPDEIIDHANDQITKIWPEAKWNFPMIRNQFFYGDIKEFNPDWEDVINNYDAGSFIKNIGTNRNSLLPLVYFFEIYEKCAQHLGYNLEGSILNEEYDELRSLVLYNNYPIDARFPTSFYAETKSSSQTIEQITFKRIELPNEIADNRDCWNTSTHEYTTKRTEEYSIKLDIFFQTFSSETDKKFHLRIISGGSAIVNTEYATSSTIIEVNFDLTDNLAIGNTVYIEGYFDADDGGGRQAIVGSIKADTKLRIETTSTIYLNEFVAPINIKNHLPDITFKKLIDIFNQTFFAVYFVDNKRNIKIHFLKDIIADTDFIDVTELAVKGLKINNDRATGFKLAFNWSSNDEFTENNFIKSSITLPVVVDVDAFANAADEGRLFYHETTNAAYQVIPSPLIPGAFIYDYRYSEWYDYEDSTYDVEISPDISPILMKDGPGIKYLPEILNRATSPSFETEENDYDVHPIFFRGGVNYPLATNTTFNDINSDVYDFALDWNIDKGIVEKFGKDWMWWTLNMKREATTNIYWNEKLLSELKPWKKYRIHETNFFISEIQIDLTNDGIEPKETVLFKAP